MIKTNNLLKEEVHCQGMKMNKKSSTVREHFNSRKMLKNLNTKLLAKKSRRTLRPEISRHKQTPFIKKNLYCVISKMILKRTLVINTQMKVTTNQVITWAYQSYFLNVIAVIVTNLIQMIIKMIQIARYLLFSGCV